MAVLNYFGKTKIYIIEKQVITSHPRNEWRAVPVFRIPVAHPRIELVRKSARIIW
jgi:hypothetical protein